MIFKTTSPISPTIKMTINNVPVEYMSLQKITVEMCENMHNMAILYFAGLHPQLIHEYINVPISFTISMDNQQPYRFVGYIGYLEPYNDASLGMVNRSPFQIVRAYCFGASYQMKSTRSLVHENKTLADIAIEIANKYQFSVSVPNDPHRFSRLVQSSQSDWAFLVQTASRFGYSVMMDGTHLQIWDPFKSLTRHKTFTVLSTLRGNRGDVSAIPGQILRFDGCIGIVTPNGARTPDTIYSLDKDGNLISAGNRDSAETSGLATPVLSSFTNVLSVNADSYEMAETLVSGALRRKFPMTATLDVVTSLALKPGRIVRINEYNSQFDGFWYVRKVSHEIMQSTIYSSLEIARDGFDGAQPQVMKAEFYQEPPDPVLMQGRWSSSKNMVHSYS